MKTLIKVLIASLLLLIFIPEIFSFLETYLVAYVANITLLNATEFLLYNLTTPRSGCKCLEKIDYDFFIYYILGLFFDYYLIIIVASTILALIYIINNIA
ncbi:MAG: hypothetical protein DRJ44_06505 [Thermoprotei archaeon]|nr:MAG: hypothetical protein DRZ80_06175 [Thermoprotei archaeon]RLE75041.1 MAG: hypothetical protein DRJ44_06505 [Thermoprotei archaeon]